MKNNKKITKASVHKFSNKTQKAIDHMDKLVKEKEEIQEKIMVIKRIEKAILITGVATISGLTYMAAKKQKVNPVGPVAVSALATIGSWAIGRVLGESLASFMHRKKEEREAQKVKTKKAA